MAHWLSPSSLFGPRGKIVEGCTEAWYIAKIRRLIGPLDPPINNIEYQKEFKTAEILDSTAFQNRDTKQETQYFSAGTLRQELERLPGSKVAPELIDFVEYLLVVDHTKRPTASEALEHPYLRSLL